MRVEFKNFKIPSVAFIFGVVGFCAICFGSRYNKLCLNVYLRVSRLDKDDSSIIFSVIKKRHNGSGSTTRHHKKDYHNLPRCADPDIRYNLLK